MEPFEKKPMEACVFIPVYAAVVVALVFITYLLSGDQNVFGTILRFAVGIIDLAWLAIGVGSLFRGIPSMRVDEHGITDWGETYSWDQIEYVCAKLPYNVRSAANKKDEGVLVGIRGYDNATVVNLKRWFRQADWDAAAARINILREYYLGGGKPISVTGTPSNCDVAIGGRVARFDGVLRKKAFHAFADTLRWLPPNENAPLTPEDRSVLMRVAAESPTDRGGVQVVFEDGRGNIIKDF